MSLSSFPANQVNELIAIKLLNSYSKELLKEFKKHKKTRNPESIHQIRVNLRRLKSVLYLFSYAFPSQKIRAWNKEVKYLLRRLNKPRDIHVMIEKLKKIAVTNRECLFILNEINKYLQELKNKQEKKLTDTLEKAHNKNMLSDILQFCKRYNKKANGHLTPSSLKILSFHCHRKLKPLLNEFSSYRSCLSDSEKVAEVHKSRLLIKKIRYILEILKTYYPSLNKFLKINADLQEILGKIHDRDVLLDFLDTFSTRISCGKIEYSEEDAIKLLGELKKLKALLISERNEKHIQLVLFLEGTDNVNFEQQLMNSF